jgi:GxxExxY protein
MVVSASHVVICLRGVIFAQQNQSQRSPRSGGRRVSDVDSITRAIISDAIAVHRTIGPGLLESTYEVCLAALLTRRGMKIERQLAMPVVFQGERLDCAYRIDLLVEGLVVVELKTVAKLEPVHQAQMMTYLHHSGCKVGLLINFNVPRLIDGLRRVVRGYEDEPRRTLPLGALGD